MVGLIPAASTRRTLLAAPRPLETRQTDISFVQLVCHFPMKKADIQAGPTPQGRWNETEPQTGAAPSAQKDATSFPNTCANTDRKRG